MAYFEHTIAPPPSTILPKSVIQSRALPTGVEDTKEFEVSKGPGDPEADGLFTLKPKGREATRYHENVFLPAVKSSLAQLRKTPLSL